MPVKVIGADAVAREFDKISNISYADFINVISQSTLSLLRNNTPVDTGELQRSWRELYKTDRTLGIGTEPSQALKLHSIVFGTKFTPPNDFITPVADVIFQNIESVMRVHLRKSHPYFNNIQRGGKIQTTANIGGLTGTKVNVFRGTGGGRKQISLNPRRNSRRVGLRRPTRTKMS